MTIEKLRGRIRRGRQTVGRTTILNRDKSFLEKQNFPARGENAEAPSSSGDEASDNSITEATNLEAEDSTEDSERRRLTSPESNANEPVVDRVRSDDDDDDNVGDFYDDVSKPPLLGSSVEATAPPLTAFGEDLQSRVTWTLLPCLPSALVPSPKSRRQTHPRSPSHVRPRRSFDEVVEDDDLKNPPSDALPRSLAQRRNQQEKNASLCKPAKKRYLKKVGRHASRYLFFVFNVLLLLAGGTMAAGASWGRNYGAEFFDQERHVSVLVAKVENIIGYCVTFGSCLFAVGLFGCFSGCCRDRCCYLLYVIFLVVFIVVQLVFFVKIVSNGASHWENFRVLFTKTLHSKYRGAYPSGEHKNVYSFVFDALNMALRCCGINNVTDYDKTSGEWKVNKLQEIGFDFSLPPTCCKYNISSDFQKFTVKKARCLFEANRDNSWMHKGCYQRISDLVADYQGVICFVLFLFVAIEGASVGLAVAETLRIMRKERMSEEEEIHEAEEEEPPVQVGEAEM